MRMRFWNWIKPTPTANSQATTPSLHERAARFRRGCEVADSLSPECLRMLVEDATVLALAATSESARQAPPAYEPWKRDRRPHHTMFIIAAEDIKAGQVIYLDAVSDGSYNAKARPIG